MHFLIYRGNKYGGENMCFIINKDQLREVATVSNILDTDMEYMGANIKQQCSNYVPEPHETKCKDALDQYLFLKNHITT